MANNTVAPNYRSLNRIPFSRERFNQIRAFLIDGTMPPHITSWNGKSKFRRRARAFTLTRDHNGLLFQDRDHTPPRVLTVVPDDAIKQTLQREWKEAGYRGRDAFYDRLKNRYIGISKDAVGEFLRNNEIQQLQRMTPSVAKAPIIKPSRPTRAFQRWQYDLTDMQAFAASNRGFRWLLVIVDVFSKFAYLFPLKNKTATGIASKLDSVFSIGEVPRILHSDNAAEFSGREMEALTRRYRIERRFGTAHKPSSQGCVERLNSTIKRMARGHMLANRNRQWVDLIDDVAFQYNTTRHSITRFMPIELHRGIRPSELFVSDVSVAPLNRASATAAALTGSSEDVSGPDDDEQAVRAAPSGGRLSDRQQTVNRRAARAGINRQADKMLEKRGADAAGSQSSEARLGGRIRVGDIVRIDLGRGRDKSIKGNRRWSQLLFRIEEIRQARGAPTGFKVSVASQRVNHTVPREIIAALSSGSEASGTDTEGQPEENEPLPGVFYRHQLMRVNLMSLIQRPAPPPRQGSSRRTTRSRPATLKQIREAEELAEEAAWIVEMISRNQALERDSE